MAAAESQSREELLANFQGITAIEDVAEAIFHLDEANWDLLAAIKRVMPQDILNAGNNRNFGSHSNDVDVEVIDEDISVIKPRSHASSHRSRFASGPSTSCGTNNSSRNLKFRLHYLEKIYEITLPNSKKYGDLQRKITELTSIPLCHQRLDGLQRVSSRCTASLSASTVLESLRLPDVCDINMTVAIEPKIDDDDIAFRLTQKFILNVEYEGSSEKQTYKLNFYGDQPVLKVKEAIHSLTNIPVREQVWIGWPSVPNLDNELLAIVGITFPEHSFVVKKSQKATHSSDFVRNPNRVIGSDDDNSDEDFEDVEAEDDDMDLDDTHKKEEPLIPDKVDDEIIGCIRFGERFNERYGPQHPSFFQGSLDEAIKEAFVKSAANRRLLGIYLHHESSISSNIFCTQLLGSENILQIIEANFLVYGWDITFESNKKMLLSSISKTLGTVASATIKNIPLERYPIFIIIMKIRSNTEIFSLVNGNASLEEFSYQLVEGVDRWRMRQTEEIQEEEDRAAREQVKWEQDEAYRQSLEADRAKEELKKQEELYIRGEKMRVETERQAAEEKRKELQQAAQERLPDEPKPDEPEITKIRFKLPEGKILDRRFKAQTPLHTLLDYLTVQGYPAEEYKIISGWPRKDLTGINGEQTLLSLKLYPHESVMLEKRSSE